MIGRNSLLGLPVSVIKEKSRFAKRLIALSQYFFIHPLPAQNIIAAVMHCFQSVPLDPLHTLCTGIDQKLAIYEQVEFSLIKQTEKHRFLA